VSDSSPESAKGEGPLLPPDWKELEQLLDAPAAQRFGDLEGAREVLHRLDTRPHFWGAETQRALAYLGIGDTAQGLSALERATDAGKSGR
jgi:hypothetical protein